ncbi:MAG: ABC transporter ATP-binding protein [Sporolactobacillus sp.]
MSYLQVYWQRYRVMFLITVFFIAGEAFADLMQPALMARIIDRGVADSSLSYIEHYGLFMLLIALFGALCASTRNILSVRVSQNFARDLREDLYQKIQHFSVDRIDKFGHATLMTRLTNDVTRVQTFANGMMRMMMKAPLVGIGSLVMAIHLNGRLSVILLVMIPIIALLIFLNMRVSFPYYRKVQHALDTLNLSLQEYLSGIRVIKIFNRTHDEHERFQVNNHQLGYFSATATKVGGIFGSLVNLAVNAGILAILWFGGVGVDKGSIQVGSVIAFTNYMMQILFAIMMVNNAVNQLIRARASAERIGSVINEKNTMLFPEETFKEAGKGTLVFEHVTFSYNGREKSFCLKSIDFSIAPGTVFGIIGPVASGKSTLAQLILRFYDPASGEIYLDGRGLSSYSERDLRSRVALVPQAPLLFSGSIQENIRWGNQEASDEEVIRAAKLAEADAFIRKTADGYQSIVGQGGVNFSGGQKQRISIARALIRHPEILILDDATSAVDALTDQKIRSNFAAMDEAMTCIIISSRVASIMDAGQILVLNEGRIEALGTHHELLRLSPYYQSICQTQMVGEGRE